MSLNTETETTDCEKIFLQKNYYLQLGKSIMKIIPMKQSDRLLTKLRERIQNTIRKTEKY